MIDEDLKKSDADLDYVEWNDNAIIIKNKNEKEIEELKIYKNGEIYLQSLSSMLPPIIVQTQENEDIVNQAIKSSKAEIIPIAFEGIEDLLLLPTKIPGTICVCPSDCYEGFFFAKIRKI